VARVALGLMSCLLAGSMLGDEPKNTQKSTKGRKTMNLGNFSVSLAVKDFAKSKEFYEKLGFQFIGGDGKKWGIMQNETSTIGLFQGMFPKNALTFNPGWDRNGKTLKEFEDVRDLQKSLIAKGLTLTTKADESSTGPAHIALEDPDGNPILIDQHVGKAK
jgi:catechol 2,3-dioxygenase-like lactoylglutathione lyase family enzyme